MAKRKASEVPEEPETASPDEQEPLDVPEVAEKLGGEVAQQIEKDLQKRTLKTAVRRLKQAWRDSESPPVLQIPIMEGEPHPAEPPSFWELANSTEGEMTVSRISPQEWEGKPLAQRLGCEIDLPNDKETVRAIISERYGGGIYDCRFKHREYGVQRTKLQVDGDPKVRSAAAALKERDEEIMAKERQIKMLQLAEREEEVKARLEQRRQEMLGKRNKEDDVAALRYQIALDKMQAGFEKQVEELRGALKEVQRESSERQRRIEELLQNKLNESGRREPDPLMGTLVQGIMNMASAAMSKTTQTDSERNMEWFQLGLQTAQSAAASEEGGLILPLLNTVAPLIGKMAEKHTGTPPPKQVEALVDETIRKRLTASPQRQLPPGGEVESEVLQEEVQQMPVNVLQQTVRVMLHEIDHATRQNPLKVPAQWAKDFYKVAPPELLETMVRASGEELAALLRREAPAEYQRLVALATTRPVIITWLNKNHEQLRAWYQADFQQKQGQAQGSEAPQASETKEQEETKQ